MILAVVLMSFGFMDVLLTSIASVGATLNKGVSKWD